MISTLPQSLIETAKKILTESTHPMIDVDGELKHRHNSNGKPIHHTDEGIRNFHRWFGDSKVVDQHGRPQVLYHGTNEDFQKFDFSKARENNKVWASNHPRVASEFALYRTVWNGANVMPVYAKSSSVHEIDGGYRNIRDVDSETDEKIKNHDAIVFRNVRDDVGPDMGKISDVWAFKNTSGIKSAIGNTGDFHPASQHITESTHPMIDVDGEIKHRHNSEGVPIHHTDEGIRNFHRWFGDSDSVDEHGRPKVFYHGTPALQRSQDENTPLPFKEFKHSDSGVTSFAQTDKFARQYADTKSQDAAMDLSPFVFKTYLKTKTFDPNNELHMAELSTHLGDTVKHSGKYGWSAFGGEKEYPKEQFLEKLKGIHDAYRPLTKEAHENAKVGSVIPHDGGRIYIHHKTPTKLYYSESYQIDGLHPEHLSELKAEAQKEPEGTISKEFKFARHESRPWDLVRKKTSIHNITWVPAKEKGDNWEYTENDEVRNNLNKLGYNAIKQTERKNENVAVFGSHQIKSATHNTGAFSHPTKIDE